MNGEHLSKPAHGTEDLVSKHQPSPPANINGCESVHPSMGPNGNLCFGLTKRELFAMAAMQGYCTEGCGGDYYQIASHAVRQADALLKELAK